MAQPQQVAVAGGKSTPFYEAIERLSAPAGGRFHMPGHKGSPEALGPLGPLARWDITEVDGADDLQHPSGPLADSEALMTRVFGAGATLYSASGSTACIQAMLTLFLAPGGAVVMLRNCHVAAVRAAAFLDLRPHWVLPAEGRAVAGDVRRALAQSGAKAVYLTSPDYYGRITDIAAVAAVCREFGARLLVDNAHGAHLRFLPGGGHPIRLGADACCDSAHKTLPCLTPAALLHLRDASLRADARRALNLYSSTSPSYPVLLSLDMAAGLLAEGPPDFAAAGVALRRAHASAGSMALPCDDPLKLWLHPAGAGLAYADVYAALVRAGVTPEIADGTQLVLMASPYNSAGDFAALASALAPFGERAASQALPPHCPYKLPAAQATIRSAVYASAERVSTPAAVGRIAAEAAAPCPPGIPVVVPGERVTGEAAALLLAGGIPALNVVK